LIRDIIYDSLLRKQKIIIHLRIAEFLEKLYNEGKYFNEYVIGEHYEKAISYEKAFNFYYKYAQKMDRSNLVHQAISGYEKCINIIEKNNLFKDKKLSIMIRLGPLYSILGKNNKALSILREAYELADERQKGNILYHQAVCYQKASKYAEALNYLSMAEKFSMDNNMKFSLYCEKAWINFLMGNIEEFGNFLNMANSFIEKIRFADGKEKDYKIARVENLFGTYFCEKGKIEEGIKRYKNALSIYEKYKDISGIEVIYNNMGSNLIFIGKIQESIDMILKSREIAKNTGNYLGYAISCNNLGENYVLLNDLKKAENFFKEYLEINKKIRNRLGDGYGNLGLAEIERRRNNFDIAENFYKKSIEILEEVKSKIIKTRAKIMYANFFLKKGNIEKADILIKDSLEYSLLQKHFPGIACCNLLTIEKFLNLLKNNKNYIKNLEELFLKFDTEIKGKLINIFCDIQYLLLKTKFLKTIGDIDKEKKTKDRLNKLMGIILNNIKNPSHREGFLNQPDFYYFIYT
jgi:tetratricopeptide (TPR) repeat protein